MRLKEGNQVWFELFLAALLIAIGSITFGHFEEKRPLWRRLLKVGIYVSVTALLSSVGISARYVHPSDDAVLAAVERLGGHSSRHSADKAITSTAGGRLLTA